MTKRGLFVGLATLDLIYLTDRLPHSNEKQVAQDALMTAGGPACNAAVTFSALGHRATLLAHLGQHPLAQLICRDMIDHQIMVQDLSPQSDVSPVVSSILVTATTGDRAVISRNAVNQQVDAEQVPDDILDGIDVVLIDGHQMAVGEVVSHQAHQRGIPIVVDAGSWKPNFERVLAQATYVICSAHFSPPCCQSCADVVNFLRALGVLNIAITYGADPVQYWQGNRAGLISVPRISVVDTLGAGDIFHGAFCSFILQTDFVSALKQAVNVASRSCQFFGPRAWFKPI